MMYVLSEDEYRDLTSKRNDFIQLQKSELQILCSSIADAMPVSRDWNKTNNSPWGCILTTQREWYCDKCPVTKICPNPNKAWSK